MIAKFTLIKDIDKALGEAGLHWSTLSVDERRRLLSKVEQELETYLVPALDKAIRDLKLDRDRDASMDGGE